MENGVSRFERTKLIFAQDSPTSDPREQPVIILGSVANLKKISYKDIAHKLEPVVTQEVWESGLALLQNASSETITLYPGCVALASLPARCSRHNSPARPHSLAQLVKSATFGGSETIIVVCEWTDCLASASAIARCYPEFSLKSCKKQQEPIEVRVEFILVKNSSGKTVDTNLLSAISDGVRLAASIVDQPCNVMGITHFLNEIEKVSKDYSLDLEVIRGEDLKKAGLGGIYGVGKASSDAPALAVLSYVPKDVVPETVVAWVGKGIVYDTGGLSIKTKTSMPGMKRDKGGAAAILGAMTVIARIGSRATFHAVFCLAENSIGPNATRPDDIHTLYSGRTVEINNTDAEGRLVLADGVVYAAKKLNPTLIIDVATLTGAQGIATGKYHAGVLTNCPRWEKMSVELGKMSGDLVFPLVYAPELHFSEFNSSVADMKNSVADRANAQPSCAGLFILSHLGFDTSCDWLHIDMASPVHLGERATGYGVTLLTLMSGFHSNDPTLQELVEIAAS